MFTRPLDNIIKHLLVLLGQDAHRQIRAGYVEYAIKVTFPWGTGPIRPEDAGPRNLYLWSGDIDLKDYEFEVVDVSLEKLF